jgi:hypothetical protein
VYKRLPLARGAAGAARLPLAVLGQPPDDGSRQPLRHRRAAGVGRAEFVAQVAHQAGHALRGRGVGLERQQSRGAKQRPERLARGRHVAFDDGARVERQDASIGVARESELVHGARGHHDRHRPQAGLPDGVQNHLRGPRGHPQDLVQRAVRVRFDLLSHAMI